MPAVLTRARKVGEWDCSVVGVTVHVSDRTRGQAMAETARRAQDAGYQASFPDVKARPCIGGGTVFCRETKP